MDLGWLRREVGSIAKVIKNRSPASQPNRLLQGCNASSQPLIPFEARSGEIHPKSRRRRPKATNDWAKVEACNPARHP